MRALDVPLGELPAAAARVEADHEAVVEHPVGWCARRRLYLLLPVAMAMSPSMAIVRYLAS